MLNSEHITYKASDTILTICQPLFEQFDLNYFRYMRVFSDNSRIILSSNPYWTEHFFSNRFYELAWFDNKPYDYYPSGSTIWNIKAIKEDNQVGIDSRDRFDMFHGITIVKRHKKFTEFVDFTATAGHAYIEEVFSMDPHILNKFILFFKDKAIKILNDAEKSKIKLPIHFAKENADLHKLNQQCKNDFLTKLNVKNYYITNDVKISARQVSCIQLAHEGLSIADIAKKLFIAERTVETHIQHTKDLLGCKKRDEVIRILINEKVIS